MCETQTTPPQPFGTWSSILNVGKRMPSAYIILSFPCSQSRASISKNGGSKKEGTKMVMFSNSSQPSWVSKLEGDLVHKLLWRLNHKSGAKNARSQLQQSIQVKWNSPRPASHHICYPQSTHMGSSHSTSRQIGRNYNPHVHMIWSVNSFRSFKTWSWGFNHDCVGS